MQGDADARRPTASSPIRFHTSPMTLMPSASSGGRIQAEPTGRTTSCSAPTPATKSTNGFDHSTIASESAGFAVERKA